MFYSKAQSATRPETDILFYCCFSFRRLLLWLAPWARSLPWAVHRCRRNWRRWSSYSSCCWRVPLERCVSTGFWCLFFCFDRGSIVFSSISSSASGSGKRRSALAGCISTVLAYQLASVNLRTRLPWKMCLPDRCVCICVCRPWVIWGVIMKLTDLSDMIWIGLDLVRNRHMTWTFWSWRHRSL